MRADEPRLWDHPTDAPSLVAVGDAALVGETRAIGRVRQHRRLPSRVVALQLFKRGRLLLAQIRALACRAGRVREVFFLCFVVFVLRFTL